MTATPQTPSTDLNLLAKSLREVFDERFVDRAVEEMDLSDIEGEGVREAAAAEAIQRVGELRALVTELGDPDDLEELYRSMAFFWLELRFAWTRYNQILQYQAVFRGAAEPTTMARGSMCAHVLSMLEGMLAPDDLETLMAIASEPLQIGAPDLARIRGFIGEHVTRLRALEARGDAPADAFARTELALVWPELRHRIEALVMPGETGLIAELDRRSSDSVDVRDFEAIGELCVALVSMLRAHLGVQGIGAKRGVGDQPPWAAKFSFLVRIDADGTRPAVSVQTTAACDKPVDEVGLERAAQQVFGDHRAGYTDPRLSVDAAEDGTARLGISAALVRPSERAA